MQGATYGSEAHNVALVLGLKLAIAFDFVHNGRFDSPAGVRGFIDGHAVAAEGARRAVLQRLVKLLVVCRGVPTHGHSSSQDRTGDISQLPAPSA